MVVESIKNKNKKNFQDQLQCLNLIWIQIQTSKN